MNVMCPPLLSIYPSILALGAVCMPQGAASRAVRLLKRHYVNWHGFTVQVFDLTKLGKMLLLRGPVAAGDSAAYLLLAYLYSEVSMAARQARD